MIDDVFDDIASWRIDPAVVREEAVKVKSAKVKSARVKSAKVKWRRHYVRVPWSWIDRLKTSTRVGTYRLALHLIYETWRNGGRPLRLANVALAGDGITPRAKRLALKELERMGLIKVERQPRKSPWVTVIADRRPSDA
jgi:hypothetical protein